MKLYCFEQFLCPSTGVYSLCTRYWYMSYRFEDSCCWSCSKAVFKPVWHIPVPSAQWINSCCWVEELPETRRVSCQNECEELVHLVRFIIKKFVTMQHGHMNVKKVLYYGSVKKKWKISVYERSWIVLNVLLRKSWQRAYLEQMICL
jgi:hypothetical protein